MNTPRTSFLVPFALSQASHERALVTITPSKSSCAVTDASCVILVRTVSSTGIEKVVDLAADSYGPGHCQRTTSVHEGECVLGHHGGRWQRARQDNVTLTMTITSTGLYGPLSLSSRMFPMSNTRASMAGDAGTYLNNSR